MRSILLFAILILFSTAKAQTSGAADTHEQGAIVNNNTHSVKNIADKKWFVSKYSGISSGYVFFHGGNGAFVAVPTGLQLSRRLNNNLYAFAGISAVPAYLNFNHSFLTPGFNKAHPVNGLFKSSNLALYSKAELGLMYVNDAKTFSFSGSIGVQRSSYPLFAYPQMNMTRLSSPNN